MRYRQPHLTIQTKVMPQHLVQILRLTFKLCVNSVSDHVGSVQPGDDVQGIPAAVRKDHGHV